MLKKGRISKITCCRFSLFVYKFFMKKSILLFSFHFVLVLSIFAQIPSGYYDPVIGKKQAELKTALHLIVMKATPPSYGSGASSTWGAFPKTDIRPEDGTVWDMYSSNHVAFNGTSAASGMNIEHSVANSWWGGTTGQTYNDLFNLNPSNSSANSSKGSWPIAVVDVSTSYTNGVIKVGKSSSRPGGTIDAWEPADEYKGDFARSYMYMVTSYEDFSAKWTGNSVNQLDNNTYPVFEQWTVDLFLKWCEQDPVSQKEIDRNNEIYKIQGNRNPYIDYPLMAEYVWGKLTTVPFSPNGNVNIPFLSSPAAGTTIDFGKVVYLQSDTASVFIKASKLKGDLSVVIGGVDAANFSIQSNIVSKADAEAGYKMLVHFNANSIGTKTAQLSISGDSITSTSVILKVVSSDEFLGLPASDITNNSFTANWSVSANATGYLLNVFTLQSSGATQSQTLFEDDFASLSAWTASGYTTATELASNVRLASGSSVGTITSAALNMSVPTSLLVRAKQYSNDAGAKLILKVNADSVTSFVTAVANQDFSINLPAKTSTSTISLSANKSVRVYVDYVKLTTQAVVQTPLSVSGYPSTVGNVLTASVGSLQPNSTYYYSVTPQGNSATVSNQITAITAINDAVTTISNYSLNWFIISNGIIVRNLPGNSQLTLYNLMGEKMASTMVNEEVHFKLDRHGVYLLQIQKDNEFISCKVIY